MPLTAAGEPCSPVASGAFAEASVTSAASADPAAGTVADVVAAAGAAVGVAVAVAELGCCSMLGVAMGVDILEYISGTVIVEGVDDAMLARSLGGELSGVCRGWTSCCCSRLICL